MEGHDAPIAEQQINEPEQAQTHEAQKSPIELALEALLGAEGEAMLQRAQEIRKVIERVERMGGLFG